MTREQYVIRRKLNILDLGAQLGNISDACRRLGISRQHYYDIRTAVEQEGVQGLVEKSRKVARVRNRVASEVEEAILQYSLEYPTHGQVRLANELRKKGLDISAGGVRSVWLRHELEIKSKRLKRLEKWAAENTGILTESQVQALERVKDVEEAHGEIETFHPGFLVAQDTCYVGTIKGVGRIYQQTGIDTYSNVGFAKVYAEKTLGSLGLPERQGFTFLRRELGKGVAGADGSGHGVQRPGRQPPLRAIPAFERHRPFHDEGPASPD